MNNTENYEIMEMRRQLASMKKQLENQEIVNDRLIKDAMSNKLSDIQRRTAVLYFITIVAIPTNFFAFRNIGISTLFCCVTAVMLAVACLATFLAHRRLNNPQLLSGNLVTVYQDVARLRKIYKRWHYVSVPLLVVWLAWLGYEIYAIFWQDADTLLFMGMGLLLGLLIGGAVGLYTHNKTLHSAEDILCQIEELKKSAQ